MLKQKSQLETLVNDKIHTYQCDPDTTLQEAFAALNTFRSYIFGRIEEQKEIDKANAEVPQNKD